jgi:hypothetical protein
MPGALFSPAPRLPLIIDAVAGASTRESCGLIRPGLGRLYTALLVPPTCD